jgi:transcription-repair coupling factor (superfamily II helicase)
LIDRFGDPPKSVLGLLTIALVRSKAEGSGIYEIKQRDGYAMMFVRNIKTPAVADIISRMKSRATLSATNKPYIAIKMQPNEKILDLLCTTLDIKGIG